MICHCSVFVHGSVSYLHCLSKFQIKSDSVLLWFSWCRFFLQSVHFHVCNFRITLCPIKFATTIPVGTTQSRNLVAVNTEHQQQNLVFGVRYRWNPTRATIKRIERQKSSSNCKRCPVSWFGHFDYYKHSSFLIRRKCSVHSECFIWWCLLIYKYTIVHLTYLNHQWKLPWIPMWRMQSHLRPHQRWKTAPLQKSR